MKRTIKRKYIHGTRRMYDIGCRCIKCRIAVLILKHAARLRAKFKPKIDIDSIKSEPITIRDALSNWSFLREGVTVTDNDIKEAVRFLLPKLQIKAIQIALIRTIVSTKYTLKVRALRAGCKNRSIMK